MNIILNNRDIRIPDDKPTLCKSFEHSLKPTPYILDVNDTSYLYYSKQERDEDYLKLWRMFYD